MLRVFICAISICISSAAIGQVVIDDEERAILISQEGLKEIAAGNYERAISIFKRCGQLNPYLVDYPYEEAFAHVLNGDTTTAIGILKKLTDFPVSKGEVFHLLAVILDQTGDTRGAINYLQKGTSRYWSSGFLYELMGKYETKITSIEAAIPHYIEGIKNAPNFPDNYYPVALYFLKNKQFEGLLIGEVFMNLERNTPRTRKVGGLLAAAYKALLAVPDTISTTVYSEMIPFKEKFNESKLLLSVQNDQSLVMLDTFNKLVLANYTANDYFIGHQNIMIALRAELEYAGYLEAYHYWLFWESNKEEFEVWKRQNSRVFFEFIKWFQQNKLVLNPINKLLK